MARKKGGFALSVDIPEDLHKALNQLADKEYTTVSHIVRQILRKHLAKQK